MSAALVVDCAAIFWMLLLKWMTSPERKRKLPDVDFAFFGLSVPSEASLKPTNSKFMLQL